MTNCHALKMVAEDGKKRLTDAADKEQLFRIIQSVPSPKAEPFKLWMAHVASHRIDQLQASEPSIGQAIADYRRLGYSEEWINQRIKSISTRKNLTNEWHRAGMGEGVQYARSQTSYTASGAACPPRNTSRSKASRRRTFATT